MKLEHQCRDGTIISYAEYGDNQGYPILIQHGLIASIEDKNMFERLIGQRVRVICIARPGYGESSPIVLQCFAEWAEIVSSLIEALEIDQFDVLGMSSGAPYGYALSARLVDKVRNIYIFSGIPAMYDNVVLAHWPYPILQNQNLTDLERLAHDLFFSNVPVADMERPDIRDAMRNNCFGVAQDLRLRFIDWGFQLSDIMSPVFIQHSRSDPEVPFATAIRTAGLIPHCHLELLENGPHFSNESLDDFLRTTVVKNL